MKKISYKIEMHTYWHCGSGLAAGADVDALVVTDKNGLPYIPGKTIKGLLKEAVDEIMGMMSYSSSDHFNVDDNPDYLKTFGYFFENKDKGSADVEMEKSEAYFSNAELDKDEAGKIIAGQLQRFMFDSVSQTAIDDNGIAHEHSLRKTQVVVPCELKGHISNVPDGMAELLEKGMKYTKCLGVGRNRGLGRCTFKVEEK